MEQSKRVIGTVGFNGGRFKELIKEMESKRTPEEREFIRKFKETERANTFYETTTVAKSDKREEKVKVVLLRPVYCKGKSIEVRNDILLSFGPPRAYNFSQDFVDRNRPLAASGKYKGFDLNIGEGLYVSNEEFVRILDDCVEVLKEKGLPLSEGY